MSMPRLISAWSARPKSSSTRFIAMGRRPARGIHAQFTADVTTERRSRASTCESVDDYLYLCCAPVLARPVRSPASSATSSSSTGAYRALRPMTQMLAELDATAIASAHRSHVDFVDDNLIGNKKAVKAFPARAQGVAAGAQLSLRFLDRGLDQSWRTMTSCSS